MSGNMSRVSNGNVSSPLSNLANNFSGLTDSIFKQLGNFDKIVQCRSDVFSQKKEKRQQFIDYQIKKMEKEEEHYKKKTSDLNRKIEECKSKLTEVEMNTSEIRKQLNEEKFKNKTLKEKISELKEDSNKFNNTSEQYLKAINKYKDFLNISIDFNNRNINIVNITFLKGMNCAEKPQLKVEDLNNNKFKILKHQFFPEDIKIAQEVISSPDMMMLLYKIQKNLNQVTGYSPN